MTLGPKVFIFVLFGGTGVPETNVPQDAWALVEVDVTGPGRTRYTRDSPVDGLRERETGAEDPSVGVPVPPRATLLLVQEFREVPAPSADGTDLVVDVLYPLTSPPPPPPRRWWVWSESAPSVSTSGTATGTGTGAWVPGGTEVPVQLL